MDTDRDKFSLGQYCSNILRLSRYNDSIIKGTYLEIQKADTELDYLYEKNFEDQALVVRWFFNEDGCQSNSCFPFYPGVKHCRPETKPFSVRLYQGQPFDVCQPACYNSNIEGDSTNSTTNTTGDGGSDSTDADGSGDRLPPYLLWSEKDEKCYLGNANVSVYYIDPYRRQSKSYDRLDTRGYNVRREWYDNAMFLETGYVSEEYCRETITSYVDADKESPGYVPGDKDCGTSIGDKILSFFIGNTFTKMLHMSPEDYDRMLHENAYNKSTERYPPTKPNLASVEAWKNYGTTNKIVIPTDVKLSDLGITDETKMWTNRWAAVSDPSTLDKYGGTLVPVIRSKKFTGPVTEHGKRIKKRQLPVIIQLANLGEKIKDMIKKLFEMIKKIFVAIASNPYELGLGIGAQVVIDNVLKATKKILIDRIPQMVETLVNTIGKFAGEKIEIKLFETTVKYVITKEFQRIILSSAMKAIVGISISLIDWFMILGFLVDLFTMFIWDGFKVNVPSYGTPMLRLLAIGGSQANLKQLGKLNVEYTPEMHWLLFVTNKVKRFSEKYLTEGFLLALKYASKRTVGSDGSLINWSQDGYLNVDDLKTEEMAKSLRQGKLSSYLLTAKDVVGYEREIDDKCTQLVDLSSKVKYILLITCAMLLVFSYTIAVIGSFSVLTFYGAVIYFKMWESNNKLDNF